MKKEGNIIDTYWHAVKKSFGIKPHEDTAVQFIRSLVVSAIALVFDFSTLIFFKEILKFNYLLAATFGFLIGVAVNYILSVVWVFTQRQIASRAKEMTFFLVISGIGLLLNLGIIAALVSGLKIDYRAAKAFSTVVVFFWNFLVRKKFLY